uniref:Amino acid transporter transmembrane domain-containing protein n=1 Tax=Panagrolaimus superbus TaxID=310955 RepID=A0A914YMV7_9BILA
MKGNIGPGCLSLPAAFKQAGVWMGFGLVFVFGILTKLSMQQLVECSQYLSRKKDDIPLDYGNLMLEACDNSFEWIKKYKFFAKFTVNATIVALQIGICGVYFVFISEHLKELTEQYSNFEAPLTTYLLLLFVPICLVSFVRTLKGIAVFSTIGNIFMTICLVYVFQYLIRTPHNLAQLPWITDFNGIMTASGSILYAFEGQAILLPMENKLKYPEDMLSTCGVLSTGMSLITIIFAACGFFGFITYGHDVKGSITLNLPNNVEFSIVKLCLTMVVFLSFAIQFFVVVDLSWPTVRQYLSTKFSAKILSTPYEYLYRIFCVFIAMSLAIGIPNLEEIIPLIGVTAGIFMAFIYPSLIDTMTFLPILLKKYEKVGITLSQKRSIMFSIIYRITRNMSLIIIAIFACGGGLYSTILELIQGYS